MLKKPYLAQCANRSVLPKKNTVTGDPEEWFNNKILSTRNLIGFSFDYFVNWSNLNISPVAWNKRIISKSPIEYLINDKLSNDLLANELIESEGLEYLKLYAKFCNTINLSLHYLLFRDIDWATNPEEIIYITIKIDTNQNLVFESVLITLKDLKEKIILYSGGSIIIGDKGLIYGTSTLECYLSRTDSLYPGDVDLLLVKKDDLTVIKMLEFKKHNLDSNIRNESLSNYYPSRDKRKYDRLSILKNYISTSIPFICMYYPTKVNDYSKLELIIGNTGSLTSSKNMILELPRHNDENSYLKFVDQTINFL